MTENEFTMFGRLNAEERYELLNLLRSGKRIEAINHIRACIWATVQEAKHLIDSDWLLGKLSGATRMSPKDEFKAEVLRIVTDMLSTISSPDMLTLTKYDILTKADVPKLFDLCMED